MPNAKALAAGDRKGYTVFFVNKFNWLDASPMATVSTMSTYALSEHGCNTTLIIEGDPRVDSNTILKEKFGLAPLPNYRVQLFRRRLFGKIKSSHAFYWRAVRHIIQSPKSQKTIIISRNTTFLPYLFLLKKLFGYEVFFEAHGYHGPVMLPELPPRPPMSFGARYSAYRFLERFFINSCSGLICIIGMQRRLYEADFVKIPTVVLPLGSRKDHIVSGENSNRPKFAAKRVVYIGRLTSHIDVDVMMKALKLCHLHGITMMWVGLKSGDFPILEQHMKLHGVPDEAFIRKGWMPHKEMIECLLSEASAGLATYKLTFRSAAVTSPTKIFDYYSIGLPVIGVRVPTVAEIVQDGIEGTLYEPGSAESLANAILAMFSSKSRYEDMQEHALNAADFYSWQSRAKRLLDFADKIFEGR
ncbi:MAG: glycosyltransferase [Chlorobiales bacterium]|nr:glycosyltransferase [Chlorobiales bacterium]